MTKFEDLSFHNLLKKSIKDMNYSTITEVQEKTIPLMINGENVICKSHTGSGKTLAFGIPISDRILSNKSQKVLILGPTRELVVQVKDEIGKLNRYSGLRVYNVYGGHGMNEEATALRRGVHILAATPGRLLDHFKRRVINPKQFDTVVLDEADRMLDMGFVEDIKKILDLIQPGRVHLFSATLDGKVATIISKYIPTYEEVIIKEEVIGKNITEKHIEVKSSDEKFGHLKQVLEEAGSSRVLVFVSTKRYADMLTEKLTSLGYSVISIHGDKSQKYRELALEDFKAGRMQILIATDVAARGLQIDNVEYVVNYDQARDADTHKHRIGRTGRMGKTGVAVTFVSDEDNKPQGRGRGRGRGGRSGFSRSSYSRSRSSSRFDDDRGSRGFHRSEHSERSERSYYGDSERPRSFESRRPFSRDSRPSDGGSRTSHGHRPRDDFASPHHGSNRKGKVFNKGKRRF